ncbi:MAG: quinol:electron acceptor oxidoreductase subunit ActD, partial [Bacteroidota bacterium]|nr:quinol:electron acceptor oxidoreductase subunit ActD [Bacteroidota bacterium]
MSKIFHVMYDDDAKVMAAASTLVGQGIRVKDVYSPFPIHGIDPIIGIKRTRL